MNGAGAVEYGFLFFFHKELLRSACRFSIKSFFIPPLSLSLSLSLSLLAFLLCIIFRQCLIHSYILANSTTLSRTRTGRAQQVEEFAGYKAAFSALGAEYEEVLNT